MGRRLLGKRLHVGNLSGVTTEADLRMLFSEYGMVISVTINRDHLTGASWGYGRVVMETREAAKGAVKGAHGHVLHERDITVRIMRHQ